MSHKKWFYTSGLEPLRGIEIIQKLLVAFFDKYLKNKNNGFLDQVPKIGDEVMVLK